MHIVFLGNCQVQMLATVLQHFAGPYIRFTTDFIDAFSVSAEECRARLDRGDQVVAQASLQPQPLGPELIPPDKKIHLVPVVSGAFVYPYQGVRHPANPVERTGILPFTPEYGDRFLAKLYMAKTPAAEAIAKYRAFDVAAAAQVGRLYEVLIENQRRLDAVTGHSCADIIEQYLGGEQLFQSAYHFGGRLARHIAAPLSDRLGFDAKYGQRIRDHLLDAPFARLFVPVHPSVAAFFGMRWVRDDTRYPFRYEGSFTFDEYVTRYMEVRWSEAVQEGVVEARKGGSAAKPKLEQGMREAPRSVEGLHALAGIAELEGDLHRAIALQRQAASEAVDAYIPMQLGYLLRKTGDFAGAAAAFRAAVNLDGVSAAGWGALRCALLQLGWLDDALAAARQEAVFALDPEPARRSVEQILAQLTARGEANAGGVFEIVAHVQDRGDTLSDIEGWAGLRGSRKAIEGFTIFDDASLDLRELTYQFLDKAGAHGEPVCIGGYCGTRGKGRPIHGFRVAFAGPLEIFSEASFVDGTRSGRVPAGEICRAPSGAALEAVRMFFFEKKNQKTFAP
jgi:tetratricopeptide (TPR) repeat protein